MKKYTLYKVSLLLGLLFIIIGALFKIMHFPGGSTFLMIGMITSFVFIIIALEDIYADKNNSPLEKLIWLIAFILLSIVTGTVYYFIKIKSKT